MIRIASFGLRRLAVPAFFAAILVSFLTVPSIAETSVEATARPTRTKIVPEATVVSTAHYSDVISFSCNAAQGFCVGYLPYIVPSRRRLNLTRISCYMQSSTYSTYATGKISLMPDGEMLQYLPVDHTTDFGHHVLNRAIDVKLTARQYVGVSLILASGGQANDAHCTVQGTLETLQ